MSCDLFIFAGEKSGDLHGDKLLQALLEKHPALRIAGVGGPLMRQHPIDCILPMEEFQVMGFIDVFRALPKLRRQFYLVANAILQLQPRIVVTIDYPGFNLRLVKYLRKKGFTGKLVHFICPSVWAWGKKRIPFMAKNLDLLLCILPFETPLFEKTTLQTQFVGHPLSEKIASYHYKSLPLNTDKKIFALFPGSRKKEIERNLPLMLKACEQEKRKGHSIHVAISVSEQRFQPLIEKITGNNHSELSLVPASFSYELMKAAHIAIAKSGTVTLELAYHQVPTIVVYAVSFLDKLIAYHLLRIRLPFYCLVNIIAGKEVFPELIGPHFTLPRLTDHIDAILQEPQRLHIQKQCKELVFTLSSQKAAPRAAEAILQLF